MMFGQGYELFLKESGILDETGQPEPHWFGVSFFFQIRFDEILIFDLGNASWWNSSRLVLA